MSDQLARILAVTLTEQDDDGLTDTQVQAFLDLFERQVPHDIKADPTRLISLLECSKDIARSFDDADMPQFTVTVQDFRFIPPSIQSELPCNLQFKLLPYTGQQQISVINSSTGEAVACSGLLRPGDTFSTTVVEPGSYVFTSEVYPFMSGQLVATGTCIDSSSKLAAERSTDCIKASTCSPELSPKLTAAGALAGLVAASKASPLKAPAAGSRRAALHASPSKGSAGQISAGSRRRELQQSPHQEQESLTAAGDSDAPPVADSDISAGAAAAVAAHSVSALTERCRRSSCGSDGWDPLAEQPSEQAVLELVTAGTQPQHAQPEPAADLDSVGGAAARFIPIAELSRSGRWARQATEYGDEHDYRSQQQPSADLADQQQQQQSVSSFANVRFAKGLEGLVFSPSCIPHDFASPATGTAVEACSSSAALVGSAGSSVLLGSCRSSRNPLDSDPGDAGSLSDDFAHDCGSGDGYERLPSHSSEHSSISDDPDYLSEPLGHLQQQLGIEQSQEDVVSEEARLLPAVAARVQCNGEGSISHGRKPVKLAWQLDNTVPANSTAGGDLDDGMDVRLRSVFSSKSGGTNGSSRSWGPVKQQPPLLNTQPAAASRLQDSGSWTSRGQVEAAAQTSPVEAKHLRFSQPPGSTWAVGGKTLKAFSSTSAHPAAMVAEASSRPPGETVAAAVKKDVGCGPSSTWLWPGTYRLGQLLPSTHGGSSSACAAVDAGGQAASSEAGLKHLGKADPGALALHQHSNTGIKSSGTPPAVQACLMQKQHQQRAAAAAAAAATLLTSRANHSRNSSSGGSSVAGAANPAPAAAGAVAKAQVTNKKKKGRSKDMPTDRAAAEARAAVEARRRDRDCVEFALLDRGSGSRGDSEDEAAGRAKGPDSLGSSQLRANRQAVPSGQLSKCKFKGCKLTFSSPLNQQRCHMSHLPSARAATAKAYKTYKAEVTAFFKALPPAAVAKLLRLPEPSWLPMRTLSACDTKQRKSMFVEQAQHNQSLSCRWVMHSAAAADRIGDLRAARSPDLSDLAQLCCGAMEAAHASPAAATAAAGHGNPGADIDNECLPLLAPPSQQQQQGSKVGSTGRLPAAEAPALQASDPAAAAAVEFAAACGVCCGSGSEATADGAGGGSCACSCHAEVQQLVPLLPSTDAIIELLEQASEGTWLCNPRLLQQPHSSSCSCSVCTGTRSAAGGQGPEQGAAAAAAASGGGTGSSSGQHGWSFEAMLASISSGCDVLDVLNEHGVNDAALSYAVERRLISAYHKAKEAEARYVMSQLLDEGNANTNSNSSSPGKAAAAAASNSKAGTAAATAAAGSHPCSAVPAAKKGKDKKKKAAKGSKPAAAAAAKRIPAWKAVSSDSEDDSSNASGGSDHGDSAEALGPLASLATLQRSTGRAAASAGALTASTTNSRLGGAAKASGQAGANAAGKAADTNLQGRLAAEQLLQARLLQQNQELQALKQKQQQKQQHSHCAEQTVGELQQQQQQHAPPKQPAKLQCQKQQQQQQQQGSSKQAAAGSAAAVGEQQTYKQANKHVSTAGAADGARQELASALPPLAALPAHQSQVQQPTQQVAVAHTYPQRQQQSHNRQQQEQQQHVLSPAAASSHQPYTAAPSGSSKQSADSHGQHQGQSQQHQQHQQQQAMPLEDPPHEAVLLSSAAKGASAHASPAAVAMPAAQSVQGGEVRGSGSGCAAASAAIDLATSTSPADVQHHTPAAVLDALATAPAAEAAAGCGRCTDSAALTPDAGAAAPQRTGRYEAGDVAGASGADGFEGYEEGVDEQEDEYEEGEGYWDEGEGEDYVDEQYWPDEHQESNSQEQQQLPLYYQQLLQQQALFLQPLLQQPGMELHIYWLTSAHCRAAQDMLVCSGRAAAAAEGHEVTPFTLPELQQVSIWTGYYYYQQMHLLGTAVAQQQVPQAGPGQDAAAAVGDAAAGAAAGASMPPMMAPAAASEAAAEQATFAALAGAVVDGSMHGSVDSRVQGDGRMVCQQQVAAQRAGSPGHQQLQASPQQWERHSSCPSVQQQQQEESVHQAFELQFGTLPADLLLLEAVDETQQQQQGSAAGGSCVPGEPATPVEQCHKQGPAQQQMLQQRQGEPQQGDQPLLQQQQQDLSANSGPAQCTAAVPSSAADGTATNSSSWQLPVQQPQQEHRQQQRHNGTFRAAEAAQLLDARWQAAVQRCGPPQPRLQQRPPAGLGGGGHTSNSSTSSTSSTHPTGRRRGGSRSSSRSRSPQSGTVKCEVVDHSGTEVGSGSRDSVPKARQQPQQRHGSHPQHKPPHARHGKAHAAAATEPAASAAAAAEGGVKDGSGSACAAAAGVGDRRGAAGRHHWQQHGGNSSSSEGRKGHAATQVWRVRQ